MNHNYIHLLLFKYSFNTNEPVISCLINLNENFRIFNNLKIDKLHFLNPLTADVTDRQTDRHIDRHTDRQTDRHTDTQTDRQTH